MRQSQAKLSGKHSAHLDLSSFGIDICRGAVKVFEGGDRLPDAESSLTGGKIEVTGVIPSLQFNLYSISAI